MKVFKYSARQFKLFGCLTPDYKNKWQNRGCRLYAFSYVVFSLLEGWSSYLYMVRSLTVSKEGAFLALYQLGVVFGPLATFFVAKFMTEIIANNFVDYQNFYDQNKYMDPNNLMKKAEERGRKIVIIASVGFGIAVTGTGVVTGIINFCYHWYRYTKGIPMPYSEIYRAYQFVLPWNDNTFWGWMGETIFSTIFPMNFFASSSRYASLLATTCEYHIAFCKIFNEQITNIDDYIRSGNSRMADLRKMYHKVVSFHIGAKELFVKSDDIYCYFVAVELFYFLFFSTFMLFHYEHTIRHLTLHLPLMTLGMAYGTSMLYLYCNYGQTVTEAYTGIAEHLYNSNWMNVPLGLQRMYVLMIANAQVELHFSGARMVELKRETYLRICRSVVGYVLMFKTMAEGV